MKIQALLFPDPAPPDTLEHARAKVKSKLKHGGMICPCCGLQARAWRITIHKGMVKWLIALYLETRQPNPEYASVRQINQRCGMFGGDYAKLMFWNLIEPAMEKRPDGKRSSGYWKITEKGISFLLQRDTRIPQHIWTFKGEVIDIEPDTICVGDVVPFEWENLLESSHATDKD